MTNSGQFERLSPTDLGNILPRKQIMDIGIRPLWSGVPRLVGPAYTVRLQPGENLMLHAAIYRAAPGSVIVVEAGDVDYAVAGGNVCAVAQRNGVAGFVIDGVIRDLAVIRQLRFPVFARGVLPIPGRKNVLGDLESPVTCGGVHIESTDMIVADEEGVAVVPHAQLGDVLAKAQANAAKEASESLDDWERAHRARTEQALIDLGYAPSPEAGA